MRWRSSFGSSGYSLPRANRCARIQKFIAAGIESSLYFCYSQSDLSERLYAPVAQLDRALACGAKGRTFESCRVYHISFMERCRSG